MSPRLPELGRVHLCDCLEGMKALPENSIDTILTDPPYGLEFMGKEWDKLVPERGRHAGTERKMFGDFKEKAMHSLPNLSQKKNPKCKKCGRYKFDRERKNATQRDCNHEWENRHFGNEQYAWHLAWASEALRVAKPGAILLTFGGTRTFHRLACAIEDAGWEIRDTVMWVYGSGFPKSLNLVKAIQNEAERQMREQGAEGDIEWEDDDAV